MRIRTVHAYKNVPDANDVYFLVSRVARPNICIHIYTDIYIHIRRANTYNNPKILTASVFFVPRVARPLIYMYTYTHIYIYT